MDSSRVAVSDRASARSQLHPQFFCRLSREISRWSPVLVAVGERIFVPYPGAVMWNERMRLLDVEIPDSDCWMVLTPDMDVYAENFGDNTGVKRTGAGNRVPATIPRGQALRFHPAFPGLNEFEAYTELAEDLVDEERERMLEEYPDLAPDAPDPPGGGHVPG